MDKKIIIAALIVFVIAIWAVLAFSHIGTGQQETQINFLSNNTIKNGENVEFELTDAQGNPISGEPLTILYEDDGKIENYSVVTDANGKGYLKLSDEDTGDHNITVKYAGNDKYGESVAKTVITIEDDASEDTSSQVSYSTDSTTQSSSSSSSGSSSDSVHYDENYNVYYNDEGVVVSGANKGSSVDSVRSRGSEHAKDFE